MCFSLRFLMFTAGLSCYVDSHCNSVIHSWFVNRTSISPLREDAFSLLEGIPKCLYYCSFHKTVFLCAAVFRYPSLQSSPTLDVLMLHWGYNMQDCQQYNQLPGGCHPNTFGGGYAKLRDTHLMLYFLALQSLHLCHSG